MTNINQKNYLQNQQQIKIELDQEQLEQLHAMIAKQLFSWAQHRKSGKKLRNLSL